MRPALLVLSLMLLGAALAACQSETTTLSGQEVVSGIPWTAPEEARYRLMDGGEERGRGVLRVEAEDGEFRFTQEFENEDFRDRTVAAADAETLRPLSVERLIAGPEGERRWQAEYEGGSAVVVQRSEEEQRRDELTVPQRAYDSWTDVYLWRTIAFAEGYEVTYADVLSATLARPQVISQTVKVERVETVEVPAGSFEAWRVKVSSDEGDQTAWYANTEERPMVRYDNGNLVFELESLE